MKKKSKQKKKEPWFLGVAHPELIKFWHPTRNDNRDAFVANISSSEMVWRQCEHGHAFKR